MFSQPQQLAVSAKAKQKSRTSRRWTLREDPRCGKRQLLRVSYRGRRNVTAHLDRRCLLRNRCTACRLAGYQRTLCSAVSKCGRYFASATIVRAHCVPSSSAMRQFRLAPSAMLPSCCGRLAHGAGSLSRIHRNRGEAGVSLELRHTAPRREQAMRIVLRRRGSLPGRPGLEL